MSSHTTKKATAVIVDDQVDWWQPVEQNLVAAGIEIVGRCASYDAGTRLVEQLRPALVIVETSIKSDHTDGLTWLSTIHDRFPDTKVVALSASANTSEIDLALARGASVYVVKRTSPDDLAAAVRQL